MGGPGSGRRKGSGGSKTSAWSSTRSGKTVWTKRNPSSLKVRKKIATPRVVDRRFKKSGARKHIHGLGVGDISGMFK